LTIFTVNQLKNSLKINFDKNTYKFNFAISKTLFYFLFLKICICIYLLIYLIYKFKKDISDIKIIISNYEFPINSKIKENTIGELYLDKYETNIYNNIKNKLIGFPCEEMWDNHREFLNGVVRKFKPKKILEIGVSKGCASSVILNAIQDLNNSHLYSIDISTHNIIGSCVTNLFPNLLSKWTLYKGNIASKFMEKIGKDIDMVLIDSAHFEPGEILDFIIVLPFLSEEAIVVMHDIANQITIAKKSRAWTGKRNEWAPYLIFNSIRGKTYLPSGKSILTHDIGAKKLDINQKKYINDYFRVLGGQWQYFPKEEYIKEMNKYFKKYYDRDCLTIFQEAVNFNRKFVKDNPKESLYSNNSN